MDVSELAPTDWDPATAAALERIRAESRTADGHDPLDEAAALRLRHHGLAGARLWLADDGFALLHDGSLELAVAPTARGRGLGSALAAAAAGDAVRAWSHGDHPAAYALAGRHGLRRARELWVMRRPASEPLPQTPSEPTVRGFRAGDEPELLRVNAAAFADHPEQGALDEAGLAERMAEPWFDPEGLLLAEDPTGRLLGFHWTKRHDERTGEVYVVAIAPDAQGQGLGRTLTLAGLHHLHGHLSGSEHDDAGGDPSGEVILYVESDNRPARAVYERLGFSHAPADTHVQYLRP
ncbi:mycothiol synthase [Nocardioides donggukensis]|uniref:Mycothiol acetyltransferase n=1 Tax=Nocardioides donggukensis TaxID=2774019 RepID=A0A927K3W8_9ACTN|nr:mycothiol synthase [Nocardioides donggukensis]MBD8868313.1 mycothiol synthase [Nocardioides donggukensis]